MRRLLILAACGALLAACDRPTAGELAAQDSGPSNAAAASPEASENAAKSKAFMAENAKAPGVTSLPSGVQYKVVKSGPEGGAKPTPADEIKIHYEGKLIDGTVFDSSYEQGVPATFVLGGLIPGWVEALQLMKPGDEWMLYIPPEQGYGARDGGPIPANSALIFRIELIDVMKRAE